MQWKLEQAGELGVMTSTPVYVGPDVQKMVDCGKRGEGDAFAGHRFQPAGEAEPPVNEVGGSMQIEICQDCRAVRMVLRGPWEMIQTTYLAGDWT